MDELKEVPGLAADVTMLYGLVGLGEHTSYSHRGRCLTLDEVARFHVFEQWKASADSPYSSLNSKSWWGYRGRL